MVDATLARGSGNFLSSSSTTLTLYNVQSETIKKSAGLIRVPFPIQDSYQSIMADLLGVSRDVVVSGRVASEDTTHLYKFARDIVSVTPINAQVLVSGDQSDTGGGQVGYVYKSVCLNIQNDGTLLTATSTPTAENIRIYVNDSSASYNAGNANMLEWSLTMYEGSSTNSF